MKVREIKISEVFTVSLKGNPSTGYLWKFVNVDGITLANQIHRSVDETTVGGPTFVTFFFRADKAGEYKLKLVKVRPWEKTTPPIEVYEETIMVS